MFFFLTLIIISVLPIKYNKDFDVMNTSKQFYTFKQEVEKYLNQEAEMKPDYEKAGVGFSH